MNRIGGAGGRVAAVDEDVGKTIAVENELYDACDGSAEGVVGDSLVCLGRIGMGVLAFGG